MMSSMLAQEGPNSKDSQGHAEREKELVRATVRALRRGRCWGQSECEEVTLIFSFQTYAHKKSIRSKTRS